MHRLFDLTKSACLAASLALTTAIVVTTPATAQEKYASIVIDADSEQVLHARFADDRRYPASLTKVMTLYMLFDAMKAGEIGLNDRLPVSAAADRQPASDLGLDAGSLIKVEDAIYALVTKSANDVAVVVAERIGGTEERFAALMTVKARMLGLESTSFYNASGLPHERQITTARDMARLATSLLETHGDYYHYFSNARFRWGSRTYRNHNKLLNSVDGVDGIKTGYTRASGFNLMASAKRGDQRIIAIMLGGNTAKARNAHVTELIEAAYDVIDDRPETMIRTAAVEPGISFASETKPALAISGISAEAPNDEAMPLGEGDSDAPLEYAAD